MAGETPRAGKSRSKRRPLNWNDDRSTNKIYASGSASALGTGQTVADSILKPGQTPTPIPTPILKQDDKAADKYYANGGSNRVRGVQKAAAERAARRQGTAPMTPPAQPPKLGSSKRLGNPAVANSFLINTKDEIRAIVDQVASNLNAGMPAIVVYVKTGARDVLMRTRAALDSLVTREIITEAQYRDIKLSYELDPAKLKTVLDKLGPPKPAETPIRTEDNENVEIDPLAFLNNADGVTPGERVVDTTPGPVTEVDTTDDDADDDSDFLASAPPAPPAPETTEAPKEEASVPAPTDDQSQDNLPRRRSRRSGRGS